MTTQNLKDVICGRGSKRRLAAMAAAAGAMMFLLLSGPAGGDASAMDATPSSQPTTQPSLVTQGLSSDGSIKLVAGHSLVLTASEPLKRVSIAQPDVADVNAIAPTNVLVTAKKAGDTQLILWDDQDHSQVIDVDVDVDLQSVRRQLKAAFPDLDITATPLNDSISLRGNVPSAEVAEQIVETTGAYAKVHNFLNICGGQQVLLAVRFAEVSKTAIRQLGVSLGGTDGISGVGSAVGPGGVIFSGNNPLTLAAPVGAGGVGGVQLFGQGKLGAWAFQYFLNALRENNLIRELAEPNLVAINGQQATFLAGGQIPIPVPQSGSGSAAVVTISYQTYGIQLAFTPLVLGNGRIRLKVAPEVSELDYSHAVVIEGSTVPALTDRKLQTTVELADGQSFALAGLLDSELNATATSVPLLGDIPILGELFRSTQYQRSETELVVLVTPKLVEPLDPDQVPQIPGERWRYPNDPEFYFFSDLGGPQAEKAAAAPTGKTVATAAAPTKGQAASAASSTGQPKNAAAPAPRFHGSYGFVPAGNGQTASAGE